MNQVDQIEVQVTTPRQQLKNLVHGYNLSRAIGVATKLKLADIIHASPCTLEQLAMKSGTKEDPLLRLLLLLSRVDIFRLDDDGLYQQTPLSDFMRFDHPHSIAREILLFAGDETYLAWSRLEKCLQTGETGFQDFFGESLFAYLSGNPHAAKRFHDGWREISIQVGKEITEGFGDVFARARNVIDVGGGHGTILVELLKSFSHICGVLYDLPCDGFDATAFATFEHSGRYSRVVGDALDFVPKGDVHIMKSVLHNFGDEDCVRILRNCSAGIFDGGRILIIERVLGELDQWRWASVVNMAMLVMTGGRERGLQEFSSLYRRAHLELEKVVAMPSGFTVMCVRKLDRVL